MDPKTDWIYEVPIALNNFSSYPNRVWKRISSNVISVHFFK